MEANIEPTSSPRGFQDALGARLPAKAVFGGSFNVLGGPRNPKNHAPATVRAQFRLKSLTAPGAPKSSPTASQNRAQNPPWRLQDGFKTRLKKRFDFSTGFQPLFVDLGGPRGGGRRVKMASRIASKTAFAPKLRFSSPGSPPGLHFDPLGPRFWTLRELIFEALDA